MHHRIPVDEPFIAIDQVFMIELDKDPPNRGGKAGVHREAFTAPIGRGPEASQLVDDGAARLFFPFPHPRDKAVPPERALRRPFRGKLVADDDLGGDAGVIGTRLPQHVATPHALVADQHILQGKVQSVPDM